MMAFFFRKSSGSKAADVLLSSSLHTAKFVRYNCIRNHKEICIWRGTYWGAEHLFDSLGRKVKRVIEEKTADFSFFWSPLADI